MGLRYALIGCGRVSDNHVRAAIDNKLEVVGLCDLKPDRVRTHISRYPNPNLAIQKLRQAIEQKRFGKLLHGAAHVR